MVVISSILVLLSNPSIAFLEIFIRSKSIGIIIGNPSMAISVPLFDALEAMLDIIVNVAENPIELSRRQKPNNGKSATGLPNNKM